MAAQNYPVSDHNTLTFQLCYDNCLPAMLKEKRAGEEVKQHLGGQHAPARAAFQVHSFLSFSCNGVIPTEDFDLLKMNINNTSRKTKQPTIFTAMFHNIFYYRAIFPKDFFPTCTWWTHAKSVVANGKWQAHTQEWRTSRDISYQFLG